MARKYTEAIALLDKALEMFPNNPATLGTRIRLAYRMGDRQAAERYAAALKSTFPGTEDPQILALRGYAAAKDGRKDEAEKMLQKLDQLRKTVFSDPVMTLDICFALGDRDCASLWLKRTHDDRSTAFVYAPLYYKDELRLIPESRTLLADIR